MKHTFYINNKEYEIDTQKEYPITFNNNILDNCILKEEFVKDNLIIPGKIHNSVFSKQIAALYIPIAIQDKISQTHSQKINWYDFESSVSDYDIRDIKIKITPEEISILTDTQIHHPYILSEILLYIDENLSEYIVQEITFNLKDRLDDQMTMFSMYSNIEDTFLTKIEKGVE